MRKRLRYSDLDFEKVMHTRKRHSELYHELNRKFHTLERYRESKGSKREKRWSISSGGGGDRNACSEKTSPAQHQQQAWESYRASVLSSMTPKPMERLELHCADWDQPCITLSLSEGDFQTEV